LFPSHHTWWLLAAVVTLNSIDWAAFDLMKNSTTASLSPGIRILDGLFQAVAVRHGGFYVVPISNVRISLQVLYVIMMYISVYPVAIAMRNTNVYEERSLGIYADDPEYVAARSASQKSLFARVLRIATPWDETTHTFVRHQVRAQLAHDLWCVVLAVFVIMCIEAGSFEKDPKLFSVFNVIFEVISAYGCVGISVGLPDQAYSFAGALRTGSKLVLCCVMLRGRHRGLPVAIDKAIMLPREGLDEVEEDNALRGLEQSAGRDRV
jgi:Trk-type K+ transport system membrane component